MDEHRAGAAARILKSARSSMPMALDIPRLTIRTSTETGAQLIGQHRRHPQIASILARLWRKTSPVIVLLPQRADLIGIRSHTRTPVPHPKGGFLRHREDAKSESQFK